MKIPLNLINEQLQVVAFVKAPKYRLPLAVVSFVVDTGSNRSLLGYVEVERNNLPQNALKFVENSKIGGSNLGMYRLEGVTLVFTDKEGDAQRIEMDDFLAGMPTSKKREAQENARLIPSILGLDFIIKTGLSLHCIPGKNEYYLEGTA